MDDEILFKQKQLEEVSFKQQEEEVLTHNTMQEAPAFQETALGNDIEQPSINVPKEAKKKSRGFRKRSVKTLNERADGPGGDAPVDISKLRKVHKAQKANRFGVQTSDFVTNSGQKEIEARAKLKSIVPGDDGLNEKEKEYCGDVKKWLENDSVEVHRFKKKKEYLEAEKKNANVVYSKLDEMKKSADKSVREMAERVEESMKGSLKVDPNENFDLTNIESFFEGEFTKKKNKKEIKYSVTSEDRSKEPLFTHEPNIEDLKQGQLGNCYFITALTQIVEKDPGFIKRSMKDNGDTVSVRFQNSGVPFTVTVSKKTYKKKRIGDPNAKDVNMGADSGALWVLIMEKAYAAILAGHVEGASGEQSVSPNYVDPNLLMAQRQDILMRGHQVYDKNPYDLLDQGGLVTNAHMFLTGKSIGQEKVLTEFHRSSISLSKVINMAHDEQRNEYKKANNLTAQQWNVKKAQEVFGFKDFNETKGKNYDVFRKNKLYSYYERKMKEIVKSVFTRDRFKTYSEFMEAMDEVETKIKSEDFKMDDFPMGGLTEEEKKKAFSHFINNLRSYGKKNMKLLHFDKGEYSKKEKKVFADMQKYEQEKRQVFVKFRNEHKFARKTGSKKDGFNAESESEGLYTGHAYAFLGTMEKEVGEKKEKRLFVKLRNPWGENVRGYDEDGRAYLLENSRAVTEDGVVATEKKTQEKILYSEEHVDTEGIFYMEFRDFLNMSSHYNVENK